MATQKLTKESFGSVECNAETLGILHKVIAMLAIASMATLNLSKAERIENRLIEYGFYWCGLVLILERFTVWDLIRIRFA